MTMVMITASGQRWSTSGSPAYGWVTPYQTGLSAANGYISMAIAGTLTGGTVVSLLRRRTARSLNSTTPGAEEVVQSFASADVGSGISDEFGPVSTLFEYDLAVPTLVSGDSPQIRLGFA